MYIYIYTLCYSLRKARQKHKVLGVRRMTSPGACRLLSQIKPRAHLTRDLPTTSLHVVSLPDWIGPKKRHEGFAYHQDSLPNKS